MAESQTIVSNTLAGGTAQTASNPDPPDNSFKAPGNPTKESKSG